VTKIDQFESVFKAAAKTSFQYEPFELPSVLVVTDVDGAQSEGILSSFKNKLQYCCDESTKWTILGADQSRNIPQLVEEVERRASSLICTYRYLHEDEKWENSLGDHTVALTQQTKSPVLIWPDLPDAENLSNFETVMAMTDHLTGDHRLVNAAATLVDDDGKLDLVNVEDEMNFERYMQVIEKIPEIDTDIAREKILNQLFKENKDYIHSCQQILKEHKPQLGVAETVLLGHHLREYRRLVEAHNVDLLVMHTKDEDQLAMHGLAYPLAVELKQTPLLML